MTIRTIPKTQRRFVCSTLVKPQHWICCTSPVTRCEAICSRFCKKELVISSNDLTLVMAPPSNSPLLSVPLSFSRPSLLPLPVAPPEGSPSPSPATTAWVWRSWAHHRVLDGREDMGGPSHVPSSKGLQKKEQGASKLTNNLRVE